MGKVIVAARIENLVDALAVQQGQLSPDQLRYVDVPEALVDTGATMLGMPRSLIAQLGLVRGRVRQARSVGGMVSLQIYQAVRLTIQGRDCACEVMELADELPVLIGQVPLELLDWVVDPQNQTLIGNPAHGGQHMVDAFLSFI